MSLRLILALAVLPISTAARAAERKPNVLVIVADDLGYADVGVQGAKDIPTPHLDALARSGVRCLSGYVSAPYCSPSRAGLLTGRYQQRFGHEFNPATLASGGTGQGLPTGEVTVADRLKQAGYATGLIGKWHQGEEKPFQPQSRGFQEFFGFLMGSHSYVQALDPNRGPILRGDQPVPLTGYLTDVLADEAVAFVSRHAKEPFFLYLAFNAVHTPNEAPPEFLAKFAAIPDDTRRAHAAMTVSMDNAIGKVMTGLRDGGLDDKTLVFFFSDNGGPIGKFASNGAINTPLRGSKGDTWEGGVRVPFFVRWKGRLAAGKTYAHPVVQLDIAATALAAAGVPMPKLDGVDLLPYLGGKKAGPPHDALYWRFGDQMAIRKGNWKLVRPDMSTDKEFGPVAARPMLFDLVKDPGEAKDLAAAQPRRVEELMASWQKWNDTLVPPAWLHHSQQKQAR